MAINLGTAYGEIQIGTGDAEASVASLSSTMQKVGGSMSLAISTPLAGLAAAGLKAAAGFEQSLNQMAVISGATGEQMDSLQEKALQLGAETSFSAGEAALGMLELSKAGLTADQTMAAIPGVLDLAAAGNLEVAKAAEIAANALNAFQLPASEATAVANLLAATANASSVEVGDLAYSFSAASSVFAANNQSIDSLATSLAILGNNGIKGSDAGTSMKTMLTRLAAPTDNAASVMARLGLSVYDSTGAMRPFGDILADLSGITATLSDEQRNAAFNTIFGADAIRAATILTSAGTDEWERMSEAVGQQGAASEVAQARMKGLGGAVDYIKGTIESVLIEVALPFLDFLGSSLRGVADLIAGFVKLPKPIINATLAFLGVLGVAGPLLVAIPMIGGVLAALLSPLGLVALAVAALAAAFAADFGGIRTKVANAFSGVSAFVGQAVFGLRSYAAAVSDAGFGSTEAKDEIELLPPALQGIAGFIDQAIFGFQSYRDAVLDAGYGSTEAKDEILLLPQALQGIVGFADQVMFGWQSYVAAVKDAGFGSTEAKDEILLLPQSLQGVVGFADQTIFGLQSYVAAVRDAGFGSTEAKDEILLFPPVLQGMVSAIDSLIPKLSEWATWLSVNIPLGFAILQAWSTTAWSAIGAAVSAAWATIQLALSLLATWLIVNIPLGLLAIQTAWNAVWAALPGVLSTAWTTAQATFTTITTWLAVNIPLALLTLQTGWNTVWTTVQTATTAAWGVVGPLLTTLATWLSVNVPLALLTVQAGWNAVWNAAPSVLSTAWTTIQTTLTTITTWLQVNIPLALLTVQTGWNAVWAALPGAVTTAQTTMTTAWTAIQTAWDALVALFGPAITRLTESFGTFGTDVSGLGGSFEALLAAVQSFWAAVQPILTMLGMVIAAVVGVVAVTAINLLAAVFDNLGAVIKIAIDQATLILNTFSTVLSELVTGATALINGDWATAWTSAQNVVGTMVTYVQGTMANLWLFVSTVFATIGATISATLADLGFDQAALAVQAVTDKIVAFTGWLSNLGSGSAGLSITQPEWVTTIIDGVPGWVTTIGDWINLVPGWIKTVTDWLALIPGWVTTMEAWLNLIPGWVTTLGAWLELVPGWIKTITDWLTKSPGWVATLIDGISGFQTKFDEIVNKLLGWVPSVSGVTDAAQDAVDWIIGKNMGGTGKSMGGLDTFGRSTLPALPFANPVPAQSFAAGTGAGITVQIMGPVNVNNGMDIEQVSWQVASRIQRHRGD